MSLHKIATFALKAIGSSIVNMTMIMLFLIVAIIIYTHEPSMWLLGGYLLNLKTHWRDRAHDLTTKDWDSSCEFRSSLT